MRTISVLGITNQKSAAVRGSARRVRHPPGSASGLYSNGISTLSVYEYVPYLTARVLYCTLMFCGKNTDYNIAITN